MKKITAIILCAVLLLPALSVGTYAETYEEDFGVVMMSAVVSLDYMDRDYTASYVYETVCNILYPFADAEKLNFNPIAVSAKEFEDTVNAHFVCGSAMFEELRKLPCAAYDAKNKTYMVEFQGGIGGFLAQRQYAGFIDNGNGTYDLYFEHITYDFLPDELNSTLEGLCWPPEYEYEGKVYQNGPDGYYRIVSYDKYGKKYTVDYKNNLTRLIAVSEFSEKDYPSKFSVRKYTYNVPSTVHVLSADAFANGTKVTIAELKSGDQYKKAEKTIETVSSKYAIYDFTAVNSGKKVQPNGDFVFEIDVPNGFGNDLDVYYVSDDGKLEKLDSELSSRAVWSEKERKEVNIAFLKVTVKHFSTYAIVDNGAKPKVTSSVTTKPAAATEPEATAETDATIGITDTVTNVTTETDATTAGETGKADDSETAADAQTTEADTELIMPGKDKNTAGIIIAVVAAVAVIAAVVAFVILKKKKK